jgi:hypothetical protein
MAKFAGHRYIVCEESPRELFDMLLDKCGATTGCAMQFKFRMQDDKLCRPVSQHEICYTVVRYR